MVGKQNNFFRDGPYDQRPFGGSGSLGNYNRGGGCKTDYNGRNCNDNGFGNTNAAPQENKNYHHFRKFRDPHSFEQRSSSRGLRRERRRERKREEQRGLHGRDGGYQNYANAPRKDGLHWFDDSVGTKSLQENRQQTPVQVMQKPHDQHHPQQQPKDHPPAPELTASAVPPAPTSPTAKAQILNVAAKSPAVNVLEQQQIIKNIKQEKVVKEVTKQIIKPPSSSSSSSSSSDSSENENTATSKASKAVIKTKLIKAEPAAKEPTKKSTTSSTSSSSSSSSEEEDENDRTENKSAKKVVKKKQSSEEDLICLGKLEKKFVIEDDASEEADVSEDMVPGKGKNICLICDKEGHTAFECQMICKNCSTPYHNMKSCPKPANLSIVMQSFMEFCMGQMNQFNPDQKFALPSYISVHENKLTKEAPVAASKKGKKSNVKSKEPRKKLIKRKRKRFAKSSDEEEDEDVKKDETEEEPSTESESESESSTEETAPKSKRKRAKTPVSGVDSTKFPKTFIPPFSTFPSFGAAAAAYNPLLLSQLMHAGNFGTPKKLNFQ